MSRWTFVISLAESMNIPCQTIDSPHEELLYAADEAFITSAGKCVCRLTQINDYILPKHKADDITLKLQNHFFDHVDTHA